MHRRDIIDDLFRLLSDTNIFVQAVIYAVLLWVFMWIMNSLFRTVPTPSQRVFLVMLVLALIGAGLTFLLPPETFGRGFPEQGAPALGAVIGYIVGPTITREPVT
jgi:hypothetical protein